MKIKVLLFFALLPMLLVGQSKPIAQHSTQAGKKVLIVVSSYGKKEGKLRPGFEFDEYSQAYLIFKANGLEIDVASPKGGPAEADEFNRAKAYNKELLEDKVAMAKLQHTIPTAKVNPALYSAIYVVGGKGAMFDLPYDPSLQELISSIYKKPDGVIAAVCHGPAAFVNVKLEDGSYLIANRKITGFCNEEEDKFGKTWKAEFPFLLEDKLKARGAQYERNAAMLPQLIRDGKLITGQNPFSTTVLAEELVRAIGVEPVSRTLYPDERSINLVDKYLKGATSWAEEELRKNHGAYDLELIAVYGYYGLIKGDGSKEGIGSALGIIELVKPWVSNENLEYEMARGYLKLGNKEKAKAILQQVVAKAPSFKEAKKLLEEIN
ncbi:DJ-1/PfpI family protein [Flavihumibacter sp. RY-1]|uniref:DJ-1/PfpI family protein n=1 Tax=Flavihumibacter fluminis TaxID=2909236 RepID=A0ABS9BH53_9BACT|nr:type 1 glutamine amidotransferase domain-containing protein [Flavihumibacter fluminis]MCF1715032.1 DJ-1/PfpI family protein [Flavihumibacter fluminis]